MPDLIFHVVSLPDDRARRATLSERLTAAAVSFTIIDAVNGANPDDLRLLGIRNVDPALTPGEVGCALSHLNVYNRTTGRRIRVLEDDVVPSAFDQMAIDAIERGLDDDDLLILGVSSKAELMGGRALTFGGYQALELDLFSRFWLRGTCSYSISRKSADRLLGLQRKRLGVADGWWRFHRRDAFRRVLYRPMFAHPPTVLTSGLHADRSRREIYGRLPSGLRLALKSSCLLLVSLARITLRHQSAERINAS